MTGLFSGARWRMVGWSMLVTVVILTATGGLLYASLSRTLIQSVDSSLAAASGAAQSEVNENGETAELEQQGYRAGLFYLVIGADGTVLSNPQNVSAQVVPPEVSRASSPTYVTTDIDGGPVRMYARPVGAASGPVILVVGQSLAAEEAARAQLLLVLFVCAALGLMLSFIGAWFLAARSLEPIQHAYQRQQEFVADASHELRTPLTILHSSADMLDDRSAEPAISNRGLVHEIRQEIVRMERLTSDLLTLARSDRGELQLSLGRVDLGALARDLAQRVAGLAQARAIALEVEAQGEIPVVEGDPDRLQQVGLIVLANALEHTPSGGRVRLVVQRQGNEGLLQVDDSGEGIPPEHIARVFDRFHRVDLSRTRSTGGAGLGLAIARSLVVAHNGRIRIANRPGGGTRVSIHLPLAEFDSDRLDAGMPADIVGR